MPETHSTFCRICEALCGLEVTVDHGRIVDIRPDRAHLATRGAAEQKFVTPERPVISIRGRAKRPEPPRRRRP